MNELAIAFLVVGLATVAVTALIVAGIRFVASIPVRVGIWTIGIGAVLQLANAVVQFASGPWGLAALALGLGISQGVMIWLYRRPGTQPDAEAR